MSELQYRMFTEKNLNGDRSPSTLDALVLQLRRTLIFFLNYFTSFIKNKQEARCTLTIAVGTKRNHTRKEGGSKKRKTEKTFRKKYKFP